MREPRQLRSLAYRAALLTGLTAVAAFGSYYAVRGTGARGSNFAPAAEANQTARGSVADSLGNVLFPTGTHLIAYVFVSSDCGWSTVEATRRAVESFPGAFRDLYAGDYASVSVVGVAIDSDVNAGIEFLQELSDQGAMFDQVSVGGSWLNDHIVQKVWRDGMASAGLPQVVLIRRAVDASEYPAHIEIGADSLLASYRGVSDILAWIDGGMSLE